MTDRRGYLPSFTTLLLAGLVLVYTGFTLALVWLDATKPMQMIEGCPVKGTKP